MRSTFGGLNIASRGLFMAQRQLDVTAHNVSNSDTVGYSRQRFVSQAAVPSGALSQFSPTERGKVGNGVESLSLDQIRDKFLDQQYRTENSKHTYWETRGNSLYYIEDVFNSTDQSSLNAVLSNFFNSIQELSKNTTDEAVRTNVAAEAKKLCETLNMYNDQLKELMVQQNDSLVAQVKRTNDYINELANLNYKIFRFELGGSIANDLRDQRNLVLDELSSMMDITVTETAFEPPQYNIYGLELTRMIVYAGKEIPDYEHLPEENPLGNKLCDYDQPYYLVAVEEDVLPDGNEIAESADPEILLHNVYLSSEPGSLSGPNPEEDEAGYLLFGDDIYGLETGTLKSYVDIRDGNNMDNQGIPYFLEQLNTLVRTLVSEFNEIHNVGYTMPFSNANDSSLSTSGIDFFDPDGLTAGTIKLSEDILNSSFNIAASGEYVTVDSDGHLQTGNNINALNIIYGLKERRDYDGIPFSLEDSEVQSYESFYKNFLGNLASEVSHANNMEGSHLVLVDSLSSQRISVMGVSVDEEMTNLIKFQHAYNSAARAITTMDEALDKLINGTGRVGL